VLAGLAATSALAWVALFRLPMDTGFQVWSARDFALMLAMWVAMMLGMMVPSAAPAVLIYAAVARRAAREGHAVASTPAFVAGYALAWTGFSVAATLAQWGLERAALLSPALVASSPRFGAAILVAAGVYQLTPWKDACLRHCRSPAHFIAAHWRPGPTGALRMGFAHGLYCLGCCWLLMALLFVGGVMNLLWIAAIALFVLGEKALPFGRGAGRMAGVALLLAGGAALLGLA
jgi:predicted metal-binding membrane protein